MSQNVLVFVLAEHPRLEGSTLCPCAIFAMPCNLIDTSLLTWSPTSFSCPTCVASAANVGRGSNVVACRSIFRLQAASSCVNRFSIIVDDGHPSGRHTTCRPLAPRHYWSKMVNFTTFRFLGVLRDYTPVRRQRLAKMHRLATALRVSLAVRLPSHVSLSFHLPDLRLCRPVSITTTNHIQSKEHCVA